MPEAGLGVLLFVANRAMEQRAYDAVVVAGMVDITLAQARVLARVDQGGTRIGELAAAARVAKQTATHLVAELVANGYVSLGPDPADRRARLVHLTDKAYEAVAAGSAEVEKVETEWRHHLGRRDFQSLERILGRLRSVVDP